MTGRLFCYLSADGLIRVFFVNSQLKYCSPSLSLSVTDERGADLIDAFFHSSDFNSVLTGEDRSFLRDKQKKRASFGLVTIEPDETGWLLTVSSYTDRRRYDNLLARQTVTSWPSEGEWRRLIGCWFRSLDLSRNLC